MPQANKKGWYKNQPIFFVESQERRNLTLVKRRRRRRDCLPFNDYSTTESNLLLYGRSTGSLRTTYACELFHVVDSDVGGRPLLTRG